MKKILFAVASFFVLVAAHAGPWDYNVIQYDQFGVGTIPRLVVLPSGTTSGIFIHNGSVNLPVLATVDTSLVISSGGVISVNAANFATVTALNGKFDVPVGTTAQYLRGDGSLATFPAIPASQIQSDWTQSNSSLMDFIKNKPTIAPATTLTTTGSGAATYNTSTGALNIPTPAAGNVGTVTSITAGTGLSGGTITASGTISLPSVGAAGTYSSVTTDAQGRVSSGTAPAQASATRTLNSAFQPHATRGTMAIYSVRITTTVSIGSNQDGDVILEIASDSGFTTNVQTLSIGENGQTVTLAVALNSVQAQTLVVSGYVPAGYYARLRTVNNTGTPVYLYRAGQEIQM